MNSNRAPGWKDHPDHRVAAKLAKVRVQVTFKGKVIADTRNAVELEETEPRETV